MKQLTCEMCGSTDLIKEDGVFVCQTCGCKYSVEEARKMMIEGTVEVEGTVTVQNSAQLENLLSLAQSSFESKNYAKAEEFCNQIIAMDDKHYEAWKLKGEAINYQIGAKNPRIEEVYNCIMTAYRLLGDNEKEVKRLEILELLKESLEGEVDFWVKHFESGRPTNNALEKTKNSYMNCYTKMADAFDELGLGKLKENYLENFDNFFIGRCDSVCASAWKTTVGYNYYRDYLKESFDSVDPFDCVFGKRCVIDNTNLYRPSKQTWDTFRNEADNLIKLLQFAEEQFNDKTDSKVMKNIFSNIVFIERRIIASSSWKITTGYTIDERKSVGWGTEYTLTYESKAVRRKLVDEYRKKKKTVPQVIKKLKDEREAKENHEKAKKYWEEHHDEWEKLDSEYKELKKKIIELGGKIATIDKANESKRNDLLNERDKKLSCEEEVEEQENTIRKLEEEYNNCGIFKGKLKRELQERIDNQEKPKLAELKREAENEKKTYQDMINSQINELAQDGKELRDELTSTKERFDKIAYALNNGISGDEIQNIVIERTSTNEQELFEKDSIVEFGSYLRDTYLDNEPIEWIVLEKQNNKALLISKYGLDYKKFTETIKNKNWEECTLRKWLNEDFIESAFSQDEKNRILETTLKNEGNKEFNISGCNDTNDKIFLLSLDEAEKYFSSDEDRVCIATRYVTLISKDVNAEDGCTWWLRTPGRNEGYVIIRASGGIGSYGSWFNYQEIVRPAMWVRIKE